MESFFTITSKNIQNEEWHVKVALNPNHPVYKGHFPERPVAPGVMLTEMVKNIVELEFNRELKMTEARNIKFMNMVLPEIAGDMNIQMTVKETENISVNATASIADSVYFKISASFV